MIDEALLFIRRLALGIALALIAVALVEKLFNTIGRSFLSLVYDFGASRLFFFADTFLFVSIALFLREIRDGLKSS